MPKLKEEDDLRDSSSSPKDVDTVYYKASQLGDLETELPKVMGSKSMNPLKDKSTGSDSVRELRA